MPTGLKRDLGLFSTMAIAIGAMVGSGIFILPGVAYMTVGEAGHPSVVMAFLVSGVLVLPAAFSAAEMATAMPEDGGSYIYVERGMGPLLGTIAGLGNWFMLSFKGALALIGGMPYLVFVLPWIREVSVPLFGDPIIPIALLLALFFIGLNIVSTSSTGTLQFGIVGLMLVVMAYFVIGGVGSIQPANTRGAFSVGESGFLAATALVFISYAGVIKVAAVAEEVKDPGRIIPQAMVGSLVITTVIYVAIVYVAIGVVDVADLIATGEADAELFAAGSLNAEGEGPIMAIAANEVLGTAGVIAVTIAALMALASTANAGLLSGSRFPFAMARDNLAPSAFETVSERFNTPVLAIAVTGTMMLFMIAFLPISEVAKFGSAFQIIVFILVNLALIGFREGAVDEYNPAFTSPLYPWMQFFGMIGGVVVLTQVGMVPLVGATVITAGAVAYYYLYASKQIDREGAARRQVRENVGEAAIERTEELFAAGQRYDTLVAVTDNTEPKTSVDLLRIGTDLSTLRGGKVTVGTFSEIPHRAFTPGDAQSTPAETPAWAREAETLPVDLSSTTPGIQQQSTTGPTISFRSITTENIGPAIVEFAAFEDQSFIVLERNVEELHELYGEGLNEHVLKNAPCGVLLVEDRGINDVETIAVATDRGVYDPVKLLVADAIAEETGAELSLLQTIPENASDERRKVVQKYHDNLRRVLTVPADSRILKTDDRVAGLARFASDADLLVTTAERRGVRGAIFGRPGDRLVDTVDCTAIMVQPADEQQLGVIQRVVLNRLFG